MARNDIYTMVADTRVYWDEDHDTRIISVIKALILAMKERFGYNPIIWCEEHEAHMTIMLDKMGIELSEYKAIVENMASVFSKEIIRDHWIIEVMACRAGSYSSQIRKLIDFYRDEEWK